MGSSQGRGTGVGGQRLRTGAGIMVALLLAVPARAQEPESTRVAPAATPVPTTHGLLGRQLAFPRVSAAREAKKAGLEARFAEMGIAYPPAGVYLRVFKVERLVEVWVRPRGEEAYVRLRTYPICQVSGRLGPKRSQGDRQIPEGFYQVVGFNPASEYHLSLRVDYPNGSDRLLGRGSALGGDIYLHGGCETVGCVPITDDHIRELYWLTLEASANGVRRIPVHIFPTRMDDASIGWLTAFFGGEPELLGFWDHLKAGYDFFEEHRRIPSVAIADGGA